MSSRSRRIGFVIGATLFVLIAPLVVMVILLPYKCVSETINRRTGVITKQTFYYGIPSSKPIISDDRLLLFLDEKAQSRDDILSIHPQVLRVSDTISQFPWSSKKEKKVNSFGYDVYVLLYALAEHGYLSYLYPEIPQDVKKEIGEERLRLWSSNEIEKHPRVLLEKIIKENQALKDTYKNR